MSILLSIIVPVYNVGSFLPKCINSIISQTFTDFELILVDDGSTDNSVEICDAAAKKDSRVRVIHKENGGVVSARKAGLSVAVGKYAGYVDGDDWIDEHMYEHMVNAMEKYNCDMVMCDVEHENKSVPLSSGSTHINISGGYYNREQLENNVFPKMIYTGVFYKFGIYPVIWNKLYKREKLIKHQMAVDDDIRTGEDAACVYPYLLECDSLYFLENLSLYHYRRSRTQMTVSYDSSYFDCFKSLYEFLSNSSIANSPYSNQLEYYQEKLRKKLFWLILYTDEETKEDFKSVDVAKYHEELLFEISSYNSLLLYPDNFAEIINSLKSALEILKSNHFNFRRYKKLVFDAGAGLKRLKVGDV